MYYDYDETNESSDEKTDTSGLSSVDSGEESKDENETEEEFDEDSVAVQKIKVALSEMMTNSKVESKLSLALTTTKEEKEQTERNKENYVSTVINTVKNFDNLETYNTDLLVLASLFDLMYKGVLNKESMTAFIDNKFWSKQHDPIDIIRYVKVYRSKKQ